LISGGVSAGKSWIKAAAAPATMGEEKLVPLPSMNLVGLYIDPLGLVFCAAE
jgi:hypothetical protein